MLVGRLVWVFYICVDFLHLGRKKIISDLAAVNVKNPTNGEYFLLVETVAVVQFDIQSRLVNLDFCGHLFLGVSAFSHSSEKFGIIERQDFAPPFLAM